MICPHCGAPWEEGTTEYCERCDRNYAGALYPETQTAEELRDTEQMIEQIRRAFEGVTRGNGMTLHQAALEGAYLDPAVFIEAAKKDPEAHWSEVPDWKIEREPAAMCFIDPEGWRFYLPAYMIWRLKCAPEIGPGA